VPNNPEGPTIGQESRRSFLSKLGVGAAVLAAASAFPFLRLGKSGSAGSTAMSDEFPGEDSIFHPASDPRQDPRRDS